MYYVMDKASPSSRLPDANRRVARFGFVGIPMITIFSIQELVFSDFGLLIFLQSEEHKSDECMIRITELSLSQNSNK